MAQVRTGRGSRHSTHLTATLLSLLEDNMLYMSNVYNICR
jgi:hypothetical protein